MKSAKFMSSAAQKMKHTFPYPQYFDWGPSGRYASFFVLCIALLVASSACTSSKPPLEYIGPNMVDGPSVKAQREDCRMDMDYKGNQAHSAVEGGTRTALPGGGATQAPEITPHCIRGVRMPPKGTIPINYEPYPYTIDEGEAAGKALKNPLRPTKAILERGQKLYETYCTVCHGTKGDGAGPIVPKFPQPPPLFSEKVTDWSDGRIFHVMTRGQNLMPSYASQVTADERWAIVHYVRALQRAAHPSDADLKRLK